MKASTKNILIRSGVAITVVLILLLVSFVVIYVILVMENNEEHRKLGHCVPLIDSALQLESTLNSTQGFLSNSFEYKELAGICEKAIDCVRVVDSSVSADVLHTFSSCQFYVFYSRDFASCADKLISGKENGPSCLKALFGDVQNTSLDRCEQWDDIQECVKSQIRIDCGDDMVKLYEKEAGNLRSSICIGEI